MTGRRPPAEDPDVPDRDEDETLCAEYALGLLSPEELNAFEARMAVDPEFRALALLWTEHMAAMADDTPAVTPPAQIEAALLARLFPVERQSWLRRVGLFPALAGGFVAALLLLWAVTSGVLLPDPSTGPVYAATVASADGSLVVETLLMPDTGTLAYTRVTGAAPEGRVLELWLIQPDTAPISLGVLHEARTGNLVLAADIADRLAGATLAISDEPPGGSFTELPTGDVRATGRLAEP